MSGRGEGMEKKGTEGNDILTGILNIVRGGFCFQMEAIASQMEWFNELTGNT